MLSTANITAHQKHGAPPLYALAYVPASSSNMANRSSRACGEVVLYVLLLYVTR